LKGASWAIFALPYQQFENRWLELLGRIATVVWAG
jgi:hypothetical protein